MKSRYFAVFKLHGFSKIFADVETVQFLECPNLSVALTINPEPVCRHFDQAGALAFRILSQGLASLKDPKERAKFVEQIEERAAKRRRELGQGVFLIFEGCTDVEAQPNPTQTWQDFDEFGILIDTDSRVRSAVRNTFRPQVMSVIACLSLAVGEGSNTQIDKLGDIVLLTSDNDKPIYCLLFTANAPSVYVVPSLTRYELDLSRERFGRLIADEALLRISEAMIGSLGSAADDLRSFVLVWGALDGLVNHVIKGSGKVRPKFYVMASRLDSENAAEDVAKFKEIYKARNKLFHSGATPELPIKDAQRLSLKYLRLHLDELKNGGGAK